MRIRQGLHLAGYVLKSVCRDERTGSGALFWDYRGYVIVQFLFSFLCVYGNA